MTSLLWLRRDLRLLDHPALQAATADGATAAVFVIDPALWDRAGSGRRAWLAANLRHLDRDLDGRLCLRIGRPEVVIPELAESLRAGLVHITRETTPAGRRRDARVAAALQRAGRSLVTTGTPYAVGPGLVRTASGGSYQVFTPFLRAWWEHGWPSPAGPADLAGLRGVDTDEEAWSLVDAALAGSAVPLPEPGEGAALRRWRDFLDGELTAYRQDRDRPAVAGTTRLSPYLKLGVVHPRTLLADLARVGPAARDSARTLVSELAWREFYADTLWHHPGSAWSDHRQTLARLEYDDVADPEVGRRFEAWRTGRTGYPLVDAGMRQLLTQGWMHNRVRMVTASFLTKDLHLWWPHGARHFLEHLIDGDVASNSHGWQWVAGTGTDAAPYFRVFNPVRQGHLVDPEGDYVRRHVPELRHLAGRSVHEPWAVLDGYAGGYPQRIVDHGQERAEALRRLAEAKT